MLMLVSVGVVLGMARIYRVNTVCIRRHDGYPQHTAVRQGRRPPQRQRVFLVVAQAGMLRHCPLVFRQAHEPVPNRVHWTPQHPGRTSPLQGPGGVSQEGTKSAEAGNTGKPLAALLW